MSKWWTIGCTCYSVFFVKQKTAYEMRISDLSSDVCSSDLPVQQSCPGHSLIICQFCPQLCQRRLQHFPSSFRPCSPTCLPCSPWQRQQHQIGRASCRERVCQYV